MDLSLVQGCTIVPISNLTPIYSFHGYQISRVDAVDLDLWYVRFDDSDLPRHFIERIVEIGATYFKAHGAHVVWFRSCSPSISATLILVSQLASDVIGAADAYYDSIECVTDADWVSYP